MKITHIMATPTDVAHFAAEQRCTATGRLMLAEAYSRGEAMRAILQQSIDNKELHHATRQNQQ